MWGLSRIDLTHKPHLIWSKTEADDPIMFECEVPDLSDFKDWMMVHPDYPEDPWPNTGEKREMKAWQKRVVTENAELLLDPQAWRSKVNDFNNLLDQVEDESVRANVRSHFSIQFEQHSFSGKLNCRAFDFPCSPVFTGVNFGDGPCTFSYAKFSDGFVDFSAATFGDGNVSFDYANFGDCNVTFEDTRFGSGEITFYKTTFGNTNFWFHISKSGLGKFSFDHSRFGDGQVSICPATIAANDLRIIDCKIHGNLFVRGRFDGTAAFNFTDVSGAADFSNSNFANIPDFRGAKFNRAPEVARMTVPPPKMTEKNGFHVAINKDDVAKLRKLKAMAIAASDHEMDGYFFALEMQAKRGHETKGLPGLFLDSAYSLLSGYGQSVWRPLSWLATSFAAFWFVYAPLILLNAMPLEKSIWFATEYSARNTVPLTNTLFRFALAPTDYKSGFVARMDEVHAATSEVTTDGSMAAGGLMDWIIGFSIAQQIIGAILLFLLILGLRNKFRMK